jgi:hypothetical protein
MDKRLENYVDVPHRIKLFYEKYPEGSLAMDPQLTFQTVGDQVIVIGRAFAYRNANDEKPGIGTAQEYLPGKTNFTRGSEIQNLETSCWGRAIGALGIGIDKSVATREEVELAMERNQPEKVVVKRIKPGVKRIVELLAEHGVTTKEDILESISEICDRPISSSDELTEEEIAVVISKLSEQGKES